MSREAFLQRVREAVQAGNRPGSGNRDGGEDEPYCDPYYQVCLTGRSAPGASTR